MAVSRRDTGVTVVRKNAKNPRALGTQVEIKNGQIGGEPTRKELILIGRLPRGPAAIWCVLVGRCSGQLLDGVQRLEPRWRAFRMGRDLGQDLAV